MNMDKIMKQAQKMQAQMAKVQEDLAGEKVEGSAGGGMVSATAGGDSQLIAVKIERQVVDPNDVEMLQDLVMAAVNEALRKVKEEVERKMSAAAGGINLGGLF